MSLFRLHPDKHQSSLEDAAVRKHWEAWFCKLQEFSMVWSAVIQKDLSTSPAELGLWIESVVNGSHSKDANLYESSAFNKADFEKEFDLNDWLGDMVPEMCPTDPAELQEQANYWKTFCRGGLSDKERHDPNKPPLGQRWFEISWKKRKEAANERREEIKAEMKADGDWEPGCEDGSDDDDDGYSSRKKKKTKSKKRKEMDDKPSSKKTYKRRKTLADCRGI